MNDSTVAFPRGVLRSELFLGVVSGVSATGATVNLSTAGDPSGSHFETLRYGRGEVGEMVLIEGQVDLVLARLVDVRLPEGERRALGSAGPGPLGAPGALQLLGTVRPDTLRISAGVGTYPRLGDRVYAAPHELVSSIPQLMAEAGSAGVVIDLGTVCGRESARVSVRPEKLFGRHCAILGATGGGKSWTVARLVEECSSRGGKVLLLDATGEYRTLSPSGVTHLHLAESPALAPSSSPCSMPPTSFDESDFVAMFLPSGRVQGPKLRQAIRSLRLARLAPNLEHVQKEVEDPGWVKKAASLKDPFEREYKRKYAEIEHPETPFDATLLARQLLQECVFPDMKKSGATDGTRWGDISDTDQSFCLSLATRIHAIVKSPAFAPVFQSGDTPFEEEFARFFADPHQRVLRLCLGGVRSDYRARELISNAIGRMLLRRARMGAMSDRPVIVIVDEAHNFLGRSVGDDDASVRLDAFELIAREGRKYGLNLCLATQRPRDLTESVLSQMGTLIVHRLTNDRDREIVERACGEIDRAATAFLANLRQGEAAIVGVDFPIPLTVQIARPQNPPASDGPDYQKAWTAAGSA